MKPSGSGRRSILLRLVARVVERERESPRYPPPLAWVLTRFGRHPDRAKWAAECGQCGRWASVNVLRLSTRCARYWCQHCGAVISLRRLDTLAPVDVLRDRPPAPEPGPGGPDLREVMAPAMLRWLAARSRRPITATRLDKSTIYQHYRGWDAYLQQLGPAGAAELAGAGELPPQPDLPAFSTIVGALHESCYHADQVVRRLRDSVGLPPEAGAEALWERVEHARRWLALHGSALCWIHSRLPQGRLAVPDRAAVEAALDALKAGKQPDATDGRAARAALFGTDGGPALPILLRTYAVAAVITALDAYLESGARPLRDDLLARLAAPLSVPVR